MFRKFEPGQFLKFSYNHVASDTGNQGLHDRFKEVLVLHPNWGGRLHGIDLKRCTAAERQVLAEVLNPETYKPGHRSALPLVEDVKRRMNVLEEIKNPLSFYQKFVRPFVRGKDVYRSYELVRIVNPVISKNSDVQGPMVNPNAKPLFKKV